MVFRIVRPQRDPAMTINENLTSFLGKPVIDFEPSAPQSAWNRLRSVIGLQPNSRGEGGIRTGAGQLDTEGSVLRIRCKYDGPAFDEVWSSFMRYDGLDSVKELVIGAWWSETPYNATSATVVEHLVADRGKLPSLRALFVGDIQVEEAEMSWIQHGDLSPLWGAYPSLEHFQVRGSDGLSLGTGFHLPMLKTLIVETGGMPKALLNEVLSAQLPSLEHLELWLGDDCYGCDLTVDDLRPLLSGKDYPKLKRLGLRNCHFADDIAKSLAKAPILSQLDVLDLSLGTLCDEGATALLESPSLGQLKRIDLHHHYISEAVQARYRQLNATVDLSDGMEFYPEEEVGDDRFVAVSE